MDLELFKKELQRYTTLCKLQADLGDAIEAISELLDNDSVTGFEKTILEAGQEERSKLYDLITKQCDDQHELLLAIKEKSLATLN